MTLQVAAPGLVAFGVSLRNAITGEMRTRAGVVAVRDWRVVLDRATIDAVRSQALDGAVKPRCGAQPVAPSQAPSPPPVDR